MKLKIQVIITADTNDADYITSTSFITEEELELIKPVINAIKKFKPYKGTKKDRSWEFDHHHNFGIEDCYRGDLGELTPEELYVKTGKCTKEEYQTFYNLLPSSEYGIHTITNVKVQMVTDEETLFQKGQS